MFTAIMYASEISFYTSQKLLYYGKTKEINALTKIDANIMTYFI